tara:strand:+ start:1656 stop:1829 length:174 start_codon:yes stop_codon:yes gene_type:complete
MGDSRDFHHSIRGKEQMSEREESILRQQALLLMARNHGSKIIIARIWKRFMKCLQRR